MTSFNETQIAKIVTHNRIVVLGGSSVGKSALIARYCYNEVNFSRHAEELFYSAHDPVFQRLNSTTYSPSLQNPTKNLDVHQQPAIIDHHDCYVDILDTVSEEQYSELRNSYIQSGDGFLLVFALNDPKSLTSLKPLYDQILHVKNVKNVPILLVGNKCDLKTTQNLKTTQETSETALKISTEWKIPYIETSAKQNQNVHEAFTLILDLIYHHKREHLKQYLEKRKNRKNKTKNRECLIM